MTSELAERPTTNAWLVLSIRCAVGLLVLLPAFILWMQVATLDNVSRSKGLDGSWHTVLLPVATAGYLIGLAVWAFTQKKSLVRDGYLVLYCAYVAGFFAWAFSAANDLEALAYVLPAVVFAIDRLIMGLATQREQSNL
jgi:hypothetical protein